MKRLMALIGWVLALAGGIAFTSNAALAQVWGIGPDGRMGYIATRNPISPNCTPPLVWIFTNGHYACGNPAPPPPTCAPGYNQIAAPTWNGSSWVGMVCQPNSPTVPNPQSVCMANLPAGWSVNGPYQGPTGAAPAGQTVFDYAGSGPQGDLDKCGNPVVYNHLQCYVQTSNSSFIRWFAMSDFGQGSCGH